MNSRIRLILLMFYDAAAVNLAFIAALLLRFDGAVPPQYWQALLHLGPVLTVLYLVSFIVFSLYNRVWAYASTGELLAIVYSVSAGTALLYGTTYLLHETLPRTVVAMGWMLIILLVGFSRFAWRMYVQRNKRNGHSPGRKALIVGAGDAGAMVARELMNHDSSLKPVGFVDDDPGKQRQQLLGLKVLGSREHLPALVVQHKIEEIIIAMPSVGGGVIREVVHACKGTGARLKILPGVYEIIDGKVSVDHLREVCLEDLLGRDPFKVDLKEIAGYVGGQTVMVTGAGGSIGSELCRQIARFKPGRLVLLGHGENSIHKIWLELKRKFPRLELNIQVADVRDEQKIDRVFKEQRPQVVFHAAAHKHVPLMEMHPDEAVKTNIFGTRNVAQAADRHGVSIFVMISTDKAVNPTSAMGATKRIAEMVVQQMNGVSCTRFTAVRFGNVLGSSGSVVPIFREQISRGGPVTVTHPEMKRYFMTIPEAVQLVIQAGSMAKGGEVFVLDMGQPLKIVDLATDMIRLCGFKPGEDVEVVFTGIRPGEKLFEELLTAEEGSVSTRHSRIFTARCPVVKEDVLHNELMRLHNYGLTNLGAPEVMEVLHNLIQGSRQEPAPRALARAT